MPPSPASELVEPLAPTLLPRRGRPSRDDGRPHGLTWNYSRLEIALDGVVHATGVLAGLTGTVVLVNLAPSRLANAGEAAAVLVYLLGLLAMLGFSAAYNLWPVSPMKWRLRRLDHAAIFLLIAATYTPFATQIPNPAVARGLLAFVWSVALAGVALKIAWPGRFDRLSILLYLGLSWSAVVVHDQVFAALPASTIWWLSAGGLLYTGGVIFHVWAGLKFQNAIWHLCVLLAAGCHYGAVLDCMVLARA